MAEEEKNNWVKKIVKSSEKSNKLTTKTPSDSFKQSSIKKFLEPNNDVKWLKTENPKINSNSNTTSKTITTTKKEETLKLKFQNESDTEEDESSAILLEESIITENKTISEKKPLKRSFDEESLEELQIESNSKKAKLSSSSNSNGNISNGKEESLKDDFPLDDNDFLSYKSSSILARAEPINLVSNDDTYKDKWTDEFVRLPCSPYNTYNPPENPQVTAKKWDLICNVLFKISSLKEFEEAILAYNPRYRGRWDFSGMRDFVNKDLNDSERKLFLESTLPGMAKLAISLPKLCKKPIPILRKGQDISIMLSQIQIASLLANAFFCTYPRRGTFRAQGPYYDFPTINFNELFEGPRSLKQSAKLRTLTHYFERVIASPPTGNVSFHRQALDEDEMPIWSGSGKTLGELKVESQGTIEDDGINMLQVDFSNKFIGGGVLGRGCVQEEIRFLINPELIVSRLFTPELCDNECLFIIGSERFSHYTGYSDTFRYAGDFVDKTPRDTMGRRKTYIVAIDAIQLKKKSVQYHPDMIERELTKAFCGFNVFSPTATIATGNWGCGAFGGDVQLKSLVQLMAAAEAGRNMSYFTFDDEILATQLSLMYERLRKSRATVANLWTALIEYYEMVSGEGKLDMELFDFLYAKFSN